MSRIFTWNEDYRIGLPVIDDAHHSVWKELIALEQQFRGNRERHELRVRIGRLAKSLRRHFQYEEALMRSVDFPGFDAHYVSHKKAHDDVLQMLDFVSYCIDNEIVNLALERAFEKLSDYFLSELVRYDNEMYGLLIRSGQATPAPAHAFGVMPAE